MSELSIPHKAFLGALANANGEIGQREALAAVDGLATRNKDGKVQGGEEALFRHEALAAGLDLATINRLIGLAKGDPACAPMQGIATGGSVAWPPDFDFQSA